MLTDPKLTARQKRELKELARRPDSEIDYSDIPSLTENSGKMRCATLSIAP